MKKVLFISLFILAHAAHAATNDITSTLADQRELALTIYNADLALVKDQRKISLNADINRLAWRDVSARIRPETALLRNINDAAGIRLLEQNFDYDLLTPQKLLEKNVGNNVTIIKTNPATGAETRETATLLAANNGVVLKFNDRVETNINGRIVYANVPDNLRDQPTLTMSVVANKTASQNLELSYLTGGLSWRADYVAELTSDNKMDLNGWVTITNQSGTSYPNTKLQFVAGDVNLVNPQTRPAIAERVVMSMAKIADVPMVQENLFEYHLYSLGRTTTLNNQQTKQVALLSAPQINVRKTLELRGADYYYQGANGDLGQKLKASVYISFDNKGGNLGVPLPKGIMRIYQKDSAGNAQFIGEDNIDHTAKNDTVRLKLGEAFDVYADKKQTDFQKVAATRNSYESAYQITLHNAKTAPVTVNVFEPIPGDWSILNESQIHSKPNANTVMWSVTIPAEGLTTLTYRVRVKF
jgi:hypothetical protein